MAAKTAAKTAPEAAPELTLRPVPERRERATFQSTLDLIRSFGLPEDQAALVATHGSHKSALSTASRLRRKHADLEFFADGLEVLARPKAKEVAAVQTKPVAAS